MKNTVERSAVLVAVLALVAVAAWPQSVDEGELKSVGERDIVFESYTGAHTVFDTAEEIVGIGRTLALSLGADGRRGDFYGLYSVIRAVDPEEKQKLDADIIVFEKSAGVDHIANVRRIITGYVQTGFGYSRADAELLAVFVTYYNAVYRGKIAELGAKYSAAVMANISAENAGIALSYKEWPGRTRLLIPLARAGVLPAGSPERPAGAATSPAPAGVVSTTELTEKKVVDQLRTEPDKGLPERKAMVDLKEREVEKATQAVAAEEKKIEERKTEVAKREEALTTQAPTPARLPAAPGTTEAKPAAEEKAIAEEKAKIAEAEQQVEAQKQAVAAKESEIARDRQGIVTDEKTTPAAQEKTTQPAATAPVSESLLYLAGRGSAGGGRLLVIDPVKRAASVTSPLGGITGRDFSYFQDRIVVLAREGQAIHLVLLDPKTLEVVSRGQDGMYEASYVHSQAGAIYAVTMQGASARLAKYDGALVRNALSTEAVDKDTYIRIFGDEVYVSASDGTILVLAAADLARKGQVEGAAP